MRQIIFKELELKNFKCHEELSFSFIPNRFVTIVGNNGTGKTTIFSALSWALYDQTIEGMSGDDVVRKRTGKNTSVTLTWDDGEDHYEIQSYRKHFKHKNNRYLFKNGIDITGTSQKETLDKISNLIMPKDIFFNCLLFSQFVKNHFLDLTPSGRNEILDSMLLLHKFNDWFKRTGKLIDENQGNIANLKDKITLSNTKVTMMQNTIENEKESLISISNSFEIKFKTLIENINNLKTELNNIIFEFDNLDDIKLEVLNLEKTKSSIETKLALLYDSLKKEKQQLEENKNNNILILKNSKKEELDNQICDDIEKIDQLKTEKNNLVSNGSKLLISLEESATNARNRDKNKRIEESEPIINSIKDLEKIINSLTYDIQTTENSIGTSQEVLDNILSHLNQKVSICYACKQELQKDSKEELKNKSNSISEDIKSEKEKIDRLRKEFDEENNKITNLKKKLEDIIQKWNNSDLELDKKIKDKKDQVTNDFQNKISEIDGKISLLMEKINEIKNSFKLEVENEISEINNLFLNNSRDIEEKNKETFRKLNQEIQDLSLEILNRNQKISKEQEKINRRNDIENQIKHSEKIQENEKNYFEQRKIDFQNKVSEIEKQIYSEKDSVVTFEKDIENLKRRDLILNFWRTGYSDTGIKAILLDDSIPVLNEKARELCDLASNLKIRFDSQTTLKSGDYRNKFGIEVLQTQNLSNLKELSSGEKRMTDIIVLLCLRHLLEERQNTRMNILLLDEILDSLDPDNASLAVAMVKKLVENHCVSLISHTLRDYVDADDTYTF